ncbi:MAG: dTMP kinase [Hyphomonadaceae bacterium]|nr:dTMP kinase [Hyphomonadaceae bacterium]
MFLTLEGGEGAGKSTLAGHLSAYFAGRGIAHIRTREPGGTPVAETLRDIALSSDLSGLTTALIMNAARSDHLEKVIRPALMRGDWVLCDRFADSTRAYQAAMGGVEPEILDTLAKHIVEDTQPHITLILDAPPELLLQRRAERGGPKDTFEARNLKFHETIRAEFLGIADRAPTRCRVLDALLPEMELAEAAIALIEAFELRQREDG